MQPRNQKARKKKKQTKNNNTEEGGKKRKDGAGGLRWQANFELQWCEGRSRGQSRKNRSWGRRFDRGRGRLAAA